MNFATFATWTELIAHIRKGAPLYYHAPLDYRPVLVRARILNFETVRIFPPDLREADPFIADPDHLPRFKKEAPANADAEA